MNPNEFGQLALQIANSATAPVSAAPQLAQWLHVAQGLARGLLTITPVPGAEEPQDHSAREM